MGVKDLESCNPEFYLQENEKVIYTLKAKKLGISYLLAFILTLLSLGIFLFFRNALKRVTSMQVIVLTNKRILMYEYKFSGCFGYDPRIIDQKWFPISDLSYYQHEFVQDKDFFFGLCHQEAYTTLRLFFSQYPDGIPPSYNNSLSFMPVTGGLLGVANKAQSAIMAGVAGNYISMAINIIQFVMKLIKLVLNILLRKEVKLAGHYIELDTADEGSFEAINELLSNIMTAYPIRHVIKAPSNPAAMSKVDDDVPLFTDVEDSVKIHPRYMQFAPDENIVDVLPHPMRVQFFDWVLAVCTFSLYYFLVIKDMRKYKGALILTDRRFISFFAHNQHGIKDNHKYIQYANCWFLKDVTKGLTLTTDSPSCLTDCCVPIERELFIDCGPGMLHIHPERANSRERIESFFAKFFFNSNYNPYSPKMIALNGASGGIPVRVDDVYRLPGEEDLTGIISSTRHDCHFNMARLCSCGFVPPHFDHSITATTHRLQVKFSISNGCKQNFTSFALYAPLKHLNGYGLHEVKPCCECQCYYTTTVGISLREDFRCGDNMWTLELPMIYTKMDESRVQSFVSGLGGAQSAVEDYIENTIQITIEGKN